jgi:hypothetical protein
VKIVLPHLGGTIPFLWQRIQDSVERAPGGPRPEQLQVLAVQEAGLREAEVEAILERNPEALLGLTPAHR